MTKNSRRKKDARAYQAAHPGTTFPDAMRAVADHAEAEPATTDPNGEAAARPPADGIDPQVMTQAVDALTAIAHSRYTSGDQVDFADALAHIVTTVAANVGSLERLLIGRPGSWEADLVARLVSGTAMDEDLPGLRSEPVRLTLYLDDAWMDMDLAMMAGDDVDEIERLIDLEDDDSPGELALLEEREEVEKLEEADRAAYVAAWTALARQVAAEYGITVPVDVTVGTYRVLAEERTDYWPADVLADRIYEDVDRRMPHPLTGQAPACGYDPQGLSKLRAAGLGYRERVARAKK